MRSFWTKPICLVLLVAMMLASGSIAIGVDQSGSTAEDYLPESSMLGPDWEITGEGGRTKGQFADALGSNGEELLTMWRWRENIYRDLARIDPDSYPNEVTNISVSVHRFANEQGAADALTVLTDVVVETQRLQDVETLTIGDLTRGLSGPGNGVNLYVLYVQDGWFLIRLGGASVSGDPAATIEALAIQILRRASGAPELSVSTVFPSPTATWTSTILVADGCWTSDDQVRSESGEISFRVPPALILDTSLQYFVNVDTSLGEFRIELDVQHAVRAANNFICLVKAGFYDGTPFFRTIPTMLIQGGDPTGTGTGGPGYEFVIEPDNTDYVAGAVALANASPARNGSQFFIAIGDLNGSISTDFEVFGHVVEGLDIVARIAETDIQATYASPVADRDVVVIESIEIVSHPPTAGPFLSPTSEPSTITGDISRGEQLASICLACHTVTGAVGVGPTWKELYGSEVELESGEPVIADDTYLAESIVDPVAKIVKGYPPAMPPFANMSDQDIADLIAYIESLGG